MPFTQLSREYEMFPRGTTVLCAVSGGADSMYLLANLVRAQTALGITVKAAHLDHGLRENSPADAAFVENWCARHGVPCTVGRADVAAEAEKRGRGVEETARSLRYEFLERTAEEVGAEVIATAHTADDNAETLLMNLTRGSGLEGLCGIPPRRGSIVRPLLDTTRAHIEEWLAEQGIPHVEDESNTDETYTRNFIRHRVMPLLKEINPAAAEHMTAAAARLRKDRDVLNAQAARVAAQAHPAEDGWVIACKSFDFVPDPVAVRAVGQLARRVGGRDLTSAHLTAVAALIRGTDPSAMLHLPGAMVCRVYGDLLFTPWREGDGPMVEQPVEPNGTTVWGSWVVTCCQEPRPAGAADRAEEFWLSADRLPGSLILRPRKEGDRLHPPGRPEKTVKKWFIDEKIPRCRRETVPVLAAGDRVAAVGGIGPDLEWLANEGESALHFMLKTQEGAEHHAS